MFVARTLLVGIVALAALGPYVAASTGTVTVQSSCTVTNVLAATIVGGLDLLIETIVGAAQSAVLYGTSLNGSLVDIPIKGLYSTEYVYKVFNSSANAIAWGAANLANSALVDGSSPINLIAYADTTGFTLQIGFAYYGGTKLKASTQVSPVSTDSSEYSVPTTLYYYNVDLETGLETSTTPFTTAAYNPWLRPLSLSFSTTAPVWSPPYTSTFSGAFFYLYCQQFTVNDVQKSVCMSLNVDMMTPWLESINTEGTEEVSYIMTELNPVGLLLASTVGVPTNGTTYASESSNSIISGTAKYIQSNGISSDTQIYLDSLGCLMTVYVWSYGSFELVYPLSSSNPFIGSTGLKWFVVSCTIEPAPTTTYTTTSSTDDSNNDDNRLHTVEGLSAASLGLIALVLIILAAFMLAPKRTSTPMSHTTEMQARGGV